MTIYNLGSIHIDRVYRLASLPRPGETVMALSRATGLGGKGANQSVAGARAGARVRHVGAIGKGEDWVLDRMAVAGVDTAAITHHAAEVTGHAIILVEASSENAIVIHPGANRALDPVQVADALRPIGPGDTLLLQNETSLQVEAAAQARAAGARVIYSAAPFDPAAVAAVAPHVSLLALNAGEAAALEAALGPPRVPAMLVTLGADGAEHRDLATGTVLHQPAFRVAAVDTTGAGDCFAGSFAAALDAGEGLPAALRFASAAAAIQVTRPGAGDAMPTRAEVERFLAERAG